jgi:hypothetical protein
MKRGKTGNDQYGTIVLQLNFSRRLHDLVLVPRRSPSLFHSLFGQRSWEVQVAHCVCFKANGSTSRHHTPSDPSEGAFCVQVGPVRQARATAPHAVAEGEHGVISSVNVTHGLGLVSGPRLRALRASVAVLPGADLAVMRHARGSAPTNKSTSLGRTEN